MKFARKIGGTVSIIGGILIVTSGFAEHGVISSIIIYLSQHTPQVLPSSGQTIAELIISILAILIGLGGITVVLGGLAIFFDHVLMGRFLIGLGGGVGIFGFIITFGYSIFTLGISSVLVHSMYWIGIILAISGAWIAKHS